MRGSRHRSELPSNRPSAARWLERDLHLYSHQSCRCWLPAWGNAFAHAQAPHKRSHVNVVASHAVKRRRSHRSIEKPVKVFERPHYQGLNESIPLVMVSVPERWRNRISSTKFPENHSLIVYEHEYFEGRQRSYGANVVHHGHLDKQVRSFVVSPKRIDHLCYTIYEKANFQGQTRLLRCLLTAKLYSI